MIQTLADLEVKYTAPIPIHCDNTSAISVSKNLVFHSKTKHIPIKYHFLREQVTKHCCFFALYSCWHVYRKSVLVIDGKNNNEPNLEREEDEKAQKR
jgi:hypothetical protein